LITAGAIILGLCGWLLIAVGVGTAILLSVIASCGLVISCPVLTMKSSSFSMPIFIAAFSTSPHFTLTAFLSS
jgi:hypothetical protein